MPRKRTGPTTPQQSATLHFLKHLAPERLDRIEAKLDDTNATLNRMAEAHERFQLDMRAAIMVQQEQIAEIHATQAESARLVVELTKTAKKHDQALATLERHLEAYLRRVPPQ
jgi:septal ring factor EnvC (AmiA/AmiB activator)